jgi:hypothetical protein
MEAAGLGGVALRLHSGRSQQGAVSPSAGRYRILRGVVGHGVDDRPHDWADVIAHTDGQ